MCDSEELAEKNGLKAGDTIGFHPIENDEPISEATIIGIYQVKEKMTPYMSGDTYRSENVIFTDLHFPEKAEQDTPLFERAYFKVANVDDYENVKERIRALSLDWELYDLIDNNGNLTTMAGNFNDLENISETMLWIVAGGSFIILFLIFLFWIRNRKTKLEYVVLGNFKAKNPASNCYRSTYDWSYRTGYFLCSGSCDFSGSSNISHRTAGRTGTVGAGSC